MARLDIERQNTVEPKRIEYAITQINALGYTVFYEEGDKSIKFMFNGNCVTLFPYSGYFNGKSVKAGRGIQKLIDQVKQ